jgi:hypothetical protein
VDDADEEFIVVGFADEQGGQCREALHFQRAYEFDEQDVELGMNDVYVERGIQAGAAYGGVIKVELHRDRVLVVVNRATAEKLGDCEFEILFSVSAKEFEDLRAGLRRVFEELGVRMAEATRSGHDDLNSNIQNDQGRAALGLENS